MYPSRWGVFATVLMFNLTNNCLFISFGAVGTKAAEFYDVDVEAIDLLSSTYLYVGIPCCFAWFWEGPRERFMFCAAFLRARNSLRAQCA